MLPILLCSLAELAIIVDRSYLFWKIRKGTARSIGHMLENIKEDCGDKILQSIKEKPGPVPQTIAAGIKAYLRHKQEHYVEKILARTGSRELSLLEHNLRGLNVIANVAPLLGLLGTVTGMIKAFIQIQEHAGGVDAAQLAGGIWEAMITTAAGLTVAIPSLLFYNYFMGKINRVETEMKDASLDLIEAVREKNSHGV